MKTWTQFNDWILPELPNVPSELVTLHVRSVATEFLRKTGLYVVDIGTIFPIVGIPTYDVDLPRGYGLARLENVWMGEQQLFPRSTDQLVHLYPNWQTVTGPPRYYFHEDTQTVRLVPIPDREDYDAITGRAVLKPLRTATGVEDWIFEDWVDVLAMGVKSELMAMPGKPWTNMPLAAEYRSRYMAACSRALTDANRALTRAPLQVQMRPL